MEGTAQEIYRLSNISFLVNVPIQLMNRMEIAAQESVFRSSNISLCGQYTATTNVSDGKSIAVDF